MESDIILENYEEEFFIRHRTTGRLNMPRYHIHDGYEIHFSLSDGYKIYVDNKIFDLNSGGLTVFNDNELHRAVSKPNENFNRYVVSFQPSVLAGLDHLGFDLFECFTNRVSDFRNCVQLSSFQIDRIVSILENLCAVYEDQQAPARQVLVKTNLAELLIFINGIYKRSEGLVVIKNQLELKKIQPIINYILKNLDKDLSLCNLCQIFYISTSGLINLFKAALDMTPNEFIIYSRITRARQLLKAGNQVGQVCESVGFHNQSHFSRTFKRIVGVPPRLYSREQ